MSALIFTESANRIGKRDGDEFKREANRLFSLWAEQENIADCSMHDVGKASKREKRARLLAGLSTVRNMDRLALFCHGWPTGISLGFSAKDIPQLAAAIAEVSSPVVHIGLYACLTGKGAFWGGTKNAKNTADRCESKVTYREGFAMYLCSELKKLGIVAEITAHLTSGHTTKNPYKVRVSPVNSHVMRVRLQATTPKHRWWKWCEKLDIDPVFRFNLMMEDAKAFEPKDLM